MSWSADVKRCEIKYRIPQSTALKLEKRVSKILKGDPNNPGPEGYMIRSLYFDSHIDCDFNEKTGGTLEHKKIRLRIYSPNAKWAKLELKEKTGIWQRKRSLSLSRADAEALISGDFTPLLISGEALAEHLYFIMTHNIYRPRCIIQYSRLAFLGPINNTRITFDKNIQASESNYDLFSDRLILYPVSAPYLVTLEVKYDGFLLSYIKDLLDIANKAAVSSSKYIMGRLSSHNIE
ncbi:MAG: polyphosphate polymerase domain-containing protein [Treponema sp.]|nr:polyphosphate polymerase domain-containing protein [Treponema sp.]